MSYQQRIGYSFDNTGRGSSWLTIFVPLTAFTPAYTNDVNATRTNGKPTSRPRLAKNYSANR